MDHVLGHLDHLKAPVLGVVLSAFDYRKTSDAYYSTEYYREMQQDYTSYQS